MKKKSLWLTAIICLLSSFGASDIYAQRYLKQYEMIFGTWEIVAFCNLKVDVAHRSFVEEPVPSYFHFGDKDKFAALGHYNWGVSTWKMVNHLVKQVDSESPLVMQITGEDDTNAVAIVQQEMTKNELLLAIGFTIFKLKKLPGILHGSIGELMVDE